MKLSPMIATPEPTYPPRRRALTVWRSLAAAVAVSATLWLPACANDDNQVALPGEVTPVQVVNPVDEPKPPEAVVKPPEQQVVDPQIDANRVEPIPPVRTAGVPQPVQP